MDKLIDVRNILENRLPLLIGNGFSIDISEKFEYESLMNLVKYENLTSSLRKLLDSSNEMNIEDILKMVEISRDVMNCMGKECVDFQPLINEIKINFIKVITDIQPSKEYYEGRINGNVKRLEILKKFSKVFTTNYDLSLYYIVSKESNSSFIDYFGKSDFPVLLTFNSQNHIDPNKIPVYYLHGNLMIFRVVVDGVYTSKVRYKNGSTILRQIVTRINENDFPVIVTEGLSTQKTNKINSNDYLKYCWKSLKDLKEDEIVVYGHSLSDSDQHIVELIDKKFKTVYYGIYNNSRQNQQIIKSKFSNSKVLFFESKLLFSLTNTV